MKINWTILDKATRHHRLYEKSDYQTWIMEEAGIHHGSDFIKIVDKDRYLMFILKWS